MVKVRILLNSTMVERKRRGGDDKIIWNVNPTQENTKARCNTIGTACSDVSDTAFEGHDSSSDRAYPPDNWSNVDYYRDYWDLNDGEVDMLWELHRNIEVDYPFESHEFECRPSTLIRFLRSHSFDLHKTEKLVRKMLVWRKQHDVNNMMENYKPPQVIIDKYVGAILQGNDHMGDPVFISRTGMTDIPGMLKMFGPEEYYKYEIYKRESGAKGEWLEEWERKAKRPFRQMTIVDDFQGLSMRLLSSKVISMFGKVMRMDQEVYPEAAKRIIVVRTPSIARLGWSMAKQFFEPFVAEKIIFCGSDYLTTLEKYMDVSILPTCLNPEGHGVAQKGFPSKFEGGLVYEN